MQPWPVASEDDHGKGRSKLLLSTHGYANMQFLCTRVGHPNKDTTSTTRPIHDPPPIILSLYPSVFFFACVVVRVHPILPLVEAWLGLPLCCEPPLSASQPNRQCATDRQRAWRWRRRNVRRNALAWRRRSLFSIRRRRGRWLCSSAT